MKYIFLVLSLCTLNIYAQYKVNIKVSGDLQSKTSYLYGYNGSSEIILSKGVLTANQWIYNVKNPYKGMMKVVFSESPESIYLSSENVDLNVDAFVSNNKVVKFEVLDKPNLSLKNFLAINKKKDQILPVLNQIATFYNSDDSFYAPLKKEIEALSHTDFSNAPEGSFTDFYIKSYQKYLNQNAKNTQQDYISFIKNAPEYLETSSFLKQLLINYLSMSKQESIGKDIDGLLNSVTEESPRGQVVLAELIDIFDIYDLKDLKEKYLANAKSLKCTINDRLSSTIDINKNTAIGAKLPNYVFTNPKNTKAKSIYDIKANKKVIMVWYSTCPHCEAELPKMIENYKKLKDQGIEIIGLSVDSNKDSYNEKSNMLPWINDSELQGWNSSYVNTYYIHGTPSFYVLDSNNIIIAKPDNFSNVLQTLSIK